MSLSFLKAYFDSAKSGSFLPTTEQEKQVLLDVYMLEKVVYQLNYELSYRPELVEVSLARNQLLNP